MMETYGIHSDLLASLVKQVLQAFLETLKKKPYRTYLVGDNSRFLCTDNDSTILLFNL